MNYHSESGNVSDVLVFLLVISFAPVIQIVSFKRCHHIIMIANFPQITQFRNSQFLEI